MLAVPYQFHLQVGNRVIETPIPNSPITAVHVSISGFCVVAEDVCAIHDRETLNLIKRVRLAFTGCSDVYYANYILFYVCEGRLYTTHIDRPERHFAFGPIAALNMEYTAILSWSGVSYRTDRNPQQLAPRDVPAIEIPGDYHPQLKMYSGIPWSRDGVYEGPVDKVQIELQERGTTLVAYFQSMATTRHWVTSNRQPADYAILGDGTLIGNILYGSGVVYKGRFVGAVMYGEDNQFYLCPVREDGLVMGTGREVYVEDMESVNWSIFNIVERRLRRIKSAASRID